MRSSRELIGGGGRRFVRNSRVKYDGLERARDDDDAETTTG